MTNYRQLYEYTMRRAFNCGRYSDPFCLADGVTYDTSSRTKDFHNIKFGISASIKKVLNENADIYEDKHFIYRLKQLDIEIWVAENMEQINQIINETHTIFLENLDLKLGL